MPEVLDPRVHVVSHRVMDTWHHSGLQDEATLTVDLLHDGLAKVFEGEGAFHVHVLVAEEF